MLYQMLAEFDPNTAKVGGILVLSVQMTLMAQIKKLVIGTRYQPLLDLLNYPVAFFLCLLLVPPARGDFNALILYASASIGLATLASITAEKVRSQPAPPTSITPESEAPDGR